MRKIISLAVLFFLTACSEKEQKPNLNLSESKPNFQTNVIYGEDDRKDWYEVLDQDVKSAAKATLGIFSSNRVQIVDDSAIIETRDAELCPSEKFSEQEKGPFCSGFLVGPDLVLTAGHCISSDEECKDFKFIFDYAKESKLHDPSVISKDKVYSCQQLLGREYTIRAQDWALVKLDRPVLDRSPVALERSNEPLLNAPLTIIGHPSGLPSKIARGGLIHDVSEHHFVADLDSFAGNSGSAVFNADTLKVEGILVRGRRDYKYVNGCYQANICEEGIGTNCKFPGGAIEGEHVSTTFSLLDLIPPLDGDKPEDPEEPIEEDNSFHSKVILPIPDSSLQTVKSQITKVPSLEGKDLKVKLIVEHTYISDLKITLVSPKGTRVVLHGNTGPRVKNINGIYGVDLKSFEPLSKLGEQPAGEWKLELTDQVPFDKGYLIEWGLIL